jgi:predicted PurR-regulated permease PerM
MDRKIKLVSTILGGVLLISAVYMLYAFIGAFALGIFVYYSTRPIYDEMIKRDFNSTLSAIFSQLVLIVPIIILVAYTIRILAVEIRSIAIRAGDSLFSFLDERFFREALDQQESIVGTDFFPTPNELEQYDIGNLFQNLRENVDSGTIQTISDSFFNVSVDLVSSLSGIFFTLFISFSLSFYLLRDGDKLKSVFLDIIDYERNILGFLNELDNDLEVVFFGNILLVVITSVFASILFTLISVFIPGGDLLIYPALIGVLCGVASLVPVIGMKIIYIPVTIGLYIYSIIQLSIPEALVFPTAFLIVSTIFIDFIPDLFARPYIGGRGGISTGLLLFSYILGPLTLGWYGLFLGPLIFVSLYEFVILILPELLDEYGQSK